MSFKNVWLNSFRIPQIQMDRETCPYYSNYKTMKLEIKTETTHTDLGQQKRLFAKYGCILLQTLNLK